LDIAHTVDASDTITVVESRQQLFLYFPSSCIIAVVVEGEVTLMERTQRKGHVQSRRDRTLPEHLEFFAQEWKKLRLAMPLRQLRSFGPVLMLR